jgi:hypothetical protein
VATHDSVVTSRFDQVVRPRDGRVVDDVRVPKTNAGASLLEEIWRRSEPVVLVSVWVTGLTAVEPHAPADRSPAAALEGQDEVDAESLGDALESIHGDHVTAALDAGDRRVAHPCPVRELFLRELPSGPMLPDDASELLELTSPALLVSLCPACAPARTRFTHSLLDRIDITQIKPELSPEQPDLEQAQHCGGHETREAGAELARGNKYIQSPETERKQPATRFP